VVDGALVLKLPAARVASWWPSGTAVRVSSDDPAGDIPLVREALEFVRG
jgi:hypothetical protein